MTTEAELRDRATKRWRWRLILPGAVGGIAGPLFGNYLFDHHRHDGSVTARVAGAAAGVVVVAALVALILRRNPRLLSGDGWFSAPLSMGVSRKQRRAAGRAVRSVRPSSDPLLRTVEADLARRAVRQGRSTAIFAIVTVLTALLAVFGNLTAVGRLCYAGFTASFAGLTVWSALLAKRAKAYLATLE